MVSRSTGSCSLPSIVARDDLGLAHGQLVALATHLLDQDRQRQLATALDLPGVRSFGRQDLDRHVADELAVEPVLDQPGRHLACPWRARPSGDVLVPIVIEIAGSSTVMSGRAIGLLRVGERLADVDLGDPGDRDDVARSG